MEYFIIAGLVLAVGFVSYLYGKSTANEKQNKRIAELVIDNVKIKQDVERAVANISDVERARLRKKYTR
jgi:hypothetical protein